MSSRPSPIIVLPALLLLVVSLWEVCATRRAAHAVPGDPAWQSAAAVVREQHRPGDLIVFAPAWNDPVGRLHLGDLIALDDAARMDAARYARIWELSIRGARAPETVGLAAVVEREVDGVTVRRFDRTPVSVLADLRERLVRPSPVVVEGGRARGPTLELAEVGFAPHRCILVVPNPGTPVRVTFPAVPLGTELVGYAGLADVFTRRDIRVPGRIQVEIEDVVVADTHLGVDDGWRRFAAPTRPGIADVTFTISAEAANRQVCFAVEIRQ